MQFYPVTFDYDDETTEFQTQLQGKNLSGDVRVSIRAVKGKPTGAADEFKVPGIKLERYGEGFKIKFDGPLTQDVSVLLEAQGNGLIVPGELFFREAGAVEEPKPAPTRGEAMTPIEKYEELVAMGVQPAAALEVIERKLGEDAAEQVKTQKQAELTA
jgi:hypothetical protein